MANEYLIIPMTVSLGEEFLEALSLDGWELVCVNNSKRFDNIEYYFKRLENTTYTYDKMMWKLVFQTYKDVSVEKFSEFIKELKENLKKNE